MVVSVLAVYPCDWVGAAFAAPAQDHERESYHAHIASPGKDQKFKIQMK